MASARLVLRNCIGDGNCAFRAFSDQLYGTQAHHTLIRKATAVILRLYKSHFSNYVESCLYPNFEEYVMEISNDGVWADDVELQAISLLYQRPVEIYDDRFNIKRTFHEEAKTEWNKIPFRVMYHESHYSSVIRTDQPFPLLRMFPGFFEKCSIERHSIVAHSTSACAPTVATRSGWTQRGANVQWYQAVGSLGLSQRLPHTVTSFAPPTLNRARHDGAAQAARRMRAIAEIRARNLAYRNMHYF